MRGKTIFRPRNPFFFRELSPDAPFCNRVTELKELGSHARNRANVVIFSPRRYGKTSLVKRLQASLAKDGIATVYVDLFGVDSVEDLAARLAARVYAVYKGDEGALRKIMNFLTAWRPVMRPDPEYGVSLTVEPAARKSGIALLEETVIGMGKFIAQRKEGVNIVLDEFQEITELNESRQVEGVMRSHIQKQANASYFFVGSRRRLLRDIFNEKKRPFYQSAVNYQLRSLPEGEAVAFIVDRFKAAGRTCPEDIARKIVTTVGGYPYYVQRIPYSIFEVSGDRISDADYEKGFRKMLEEERPVYESMLQSLSLQQTRLLTALATQPTASLYSAAYMAKHGLGSIGGVQGAARKLVALDFIEKSGAVFSVVDPVFGIWLRRLKDGGT